MTTTFVFDNLAFSVPRPGRNTNDGKAIADSEILGEENELIPAVARAPFTYTENTRTKTKTMSTTLNVELFGFGWPSSNDAAGRSDNNRPQLTNIICFIPGVCESAETWTVQHLARLCSSSRRQQRQQEEKFPLNMMAVLELEGHGLSSGPRVVLRPSGRQGLKRLVDQVVAFCLHVVQIALSKQVKDSTASLSEKINVVLAGTSLGGILAAYAAPKVFQELEQFDEIQSSTDDRRCNVRFGGCLLLSPAVGVAPEACPSPIVLNALSCLAWIAPSSAILTPEEDPSHYSCPPWSTRNFKGQWPLVTSKLLLDITSEIVPQDALNAANDTSPANEDDEGSNILSFHLPNIDGANYVYRILVLTGQKDPVVPVETVRKFVDSLNRRKNGTSSEGDAVRRDDTNACSLVELSKGDHGLLARKNGKVVDATMIEIQKFLNSF